MGGVQHSINLALYGYSHQNPIKYVDSDGNQPFPSERFKMPTPAPKQILGTNDYYKFRHEDFVKRYGSAPPSYYLSYGGKYVEKFSNLKKDLSSQGQKWVDKTRLALQVKMEKALASVPGIELFNEGFQDMAFDTHPDAYIESGLFDLSVTDLFKIGKTPELKDLSSERGRKQILEVIQRYGESKTGEAKEKFNQGFEKFKKNLNEAFGDSE